MTAAAIAIQTAEQLAAMPAVSGALHPDGFGWVGLILWMPLVSLVLCGVCAALRVRTKLPAWITVGSLATSFILTVVLWMSYEDLIMIYNVP